MQERFRQDAEARLRVLRMRYWPVVAVAAVVMGVLFGWVATLVPNGILRTVVIASPVVVLAVVVVMALGAFRIARRVRLGRFVLTDAGIHFEAREMESLGGSIPWSGVGKAVVHGANDWRMRRAGVRALVVLPVGATDWERSRVRGQFGNAAIVVSWLSDQNAARAQALIEAHAVAPHAVP